MCYTCDPERDDWREKDMSLSLKTIHYFILCFILLRRNFVSFATER